MNKDNIFQNDIAEIIIDEKQLQKRIKELGEEITAYYDQEDDIVMLCILRGAILFMADLSRHLDLPVVFDFMDVSSYGAGTESSGVVKIVKDMEENIEGRHLLIVEDIIDTGRTLKHVVDMLETRAPASIKVVTLLDKPERRVQKEMEADFNGFEIPDKFVIGYGLDFAEKYRNLPFIGVLKEEMYA